MMKLKLDENRFRELDFIMTCIIANFTPEILSWKKQEKKRHELELNVELGEPFLK